MSDTAPLENTSPSSALPPSPEVVPAPVPGPVPQPVYDSRFSSLEDALAFAQSHGQGPLVVGSDGTVTNQFGEVMVYDSDGNLAPKPGTMPGTIPALPPVPVPPVPAVPPVPPVTPVTPPAAPVVQTTVYESRFNTLAEALAYAQSHGQGLLTVGSDGTITNRFGEIMVYDSDGNLAPKPGSMPGAVPVDPLAPARPVTPPVADTTVYKSRFTSTAEAIAYAQSHGQGLLTVGSDGTITNRFGEVMVYDSDGNLAPKPHSTPVVPVQPVAPITGTGSVNAPNANSAGYVPLPEFGSVAYKALLLETGRSDLVGFNYAAHLAVKTSASLPNFDQFINAPSGKDLVTLLGSLDVNQLMATASSSQVQQLVSKFAQDPAFSSYLNAKTELQAPTAGSAAYQALLLQTGRKDLSDFDYKAHIQALTQAEESVRKIGLADKFSQAKIRYSDAVTSNADPSSAATNATAASANASREDSLIIIGSDKDDTIVGTAGKDVLIAGKGNDKLNGGAGTDHAVFDVSAANARLIKAADDKWQVAVGSEVKEMQGVERIHFGDENLALDLGSDEPAGQTVLLIGAVFGAAQVSNPNFVGIGLDLLDNGTLYSDLSDLAIQAAGLSTPEKLVGTLWANVVGSPATPSDMAPFVDMLAQGMKPHELVALAAETSLNQTRVNLVGLAEQGVDYVAP